VLPEPLEEVARGGCPQDPPALALERPEDLPEHPDSLLRLRVE
jgi:hypothetical protein